MATIPPPVVDILADRRATATVARATTVAVGVQSVAAEPVVNRASFITPQAVSIQAPTVVRNQPTITPVVTPASSTTVGVNGVVPTVSTTAANNNLINEVAQLVESILSSEASRTVPTIVNKPAGNIDGEIQFYNGGNFAVDKDFKYDSGTDSLQINGTVEAGNLLVSYKSYLGDAPNVYINGGSSGQILAATGGGNTQWITGYSNINAASYLSTYTGNLLAGNVRIINGANLNTVTANTVSSNVVTANTANLTTVGINSLTVTGTSNLGGVNSVTITGGSNGQVLTTNGNGSLNWTTVSGNGNITINSELTNGTSNVIVNADSNVTFGVAGLPEVLTITNAGALANLFTSNNYTLGNSTTTISTNRWMDAITTSTNPTVLFSASNTFSSIDVHITSVGDTSKQISKLLSVTQGATTNYSLYGTVTVGNDLADFTMDQTGGNVRVIATSTTANRVDYRLVITLYN
jgi:hypothetical protein